MIAIVDYGMGNCGSVANMFRKMGSSCTLTCAPDVLKGASKLILPGVGAFDQGVLGLRQRGLIDILSEIVLERKTPVLGICLGMQLMCRGSDEGQQPGLGWVPARVRRFPSSHDGKLLRVPHMGWNAVSARTTSTLFQSWEPGRPMRFYFVHSYHVVCDDPELVSSRATHGIEFCASLERGRIFGVQFHPEKSHTYGVQLLRNFANLS